MVPEARRKVAANYAEERYTSKSNPVKARSESETCESIRRLPWTGHSYPGQVLSLSRVAGTHS